MARNPPQRGPQPPRDLLRTRPDRDPTAIIYNRGPDRDRLRPRPDRDPTATGYDRDLPAINNDRNPTAID